MTTGEAISWFENRMKNVTMPGARSMYAMALTALREQEEREKPKPLSLDELRKMGGEPYYHVSLQGGENHWAILDPFIANQIECYHYGECWLAYRSKPKE